VEVLELADTITVIRDGVSIESKRRNQWNHDTIVAAMVGREIKDLFPRRLSTKGAPLLRVENLTTHQLEEIHFEVYAGEVLGIGGLMGAGRSELLMHLFDGQDQRQSGQVFLNGKPHNQPSARVSIDRGLIMVTEDRKKLGLILDESVAFNMSLSHLQEFVRGGFINPFIEMKTNRQFASQLKIKAHDLSMPVGELSGGNQQKVVLAKAMMTEPHVVFLDEPTRGIDVGAKVEVYELINELTDNGKAVVLVSSEMPELLGMSDRVLILSNGKISGEFDPQSTNQQQLLQAAMKFN
ncbi:MAG: ATP-binding cassette domain-containing protein, partial [Planctomycetota bacterium]